MNCIDLSALRHKGVPAVSETFGLLLRFVGNILVKLKNLFLFRYPMVTYCHDSPKLCVGTKTGVLALYDLKTPKYQVRVSR